jgi:hypothetical protein
MLRLASIAALVSLAAVPAHADDPPAASAGSGSAAAAAGWTAEFDQLFPQRADKAVLAKLYKLAEGALKGNDADFEGNWRLAALLNWDANNYPDGDLKAGLGKRAWTVADKAIAAKPDDVRGQYNAATGIGLYSEGVGILTALSQGLEGKFKSRNEAALRIDKDYANGAPQSLWGRFFFKLPWPKRDLDKSVQILTAAVASHPTNLRAKYYLADSLLATDKKADAKKLADEVMAAPVGADPSEDNKVKSETANWLKAHEGDLR